VTVTVNHSRIRRPCRHCRECRIPLPRLCAASASLASRRSAPAQGLFLFRKPGAWSLELFSSETLSRQIGGGRYLSAAGNLGPIFRSATCRRPDNQSRVTQLSGKIGLKPAYRPPNGTTDQTTLFPRPMVLILRTIGHSAIIYRNRVEATSLAAAGLRVHVS